MPAAPEATMEQRLLWEKELLGLYVSGHPLDKFKERLAKRNMTLAELKERVKPGVTTVTGGMIEDVRVIMTRGGDQMAFIRIADYDGSIEAVVFPKSYAEHKNIITARILHRHQRQALITKRRALAGCRRAQSAVISLIYGRARS